MPSRLVLYRIDGGSRGNPEMLSSGDSCPVINSALNSQPVALGNKGTLAALCGTDSKIRLLDLASLKILRTLSFPCQSSASFTFSPDDRLLYTQGDDGILRIYDTAVPCWRFELTTARSFWIPNPSRLSQLSRIVLTSGRTSAKS